MAKFHKAHSVASIEAFLEADEQRRQENANFDDPYLCCVVCGYTMKKSYAMEHKLERCPQCGTDKPARVQNLPYDPKLANAPVPTYKEALATERANAIPRRGIK
jgi:hypothetical protein